MTLWGTPVLLEGIKKEPSTPVRPLQLFQSGVEVAGWVLLGCLGEVLKLMELTGLGDGIQELEKCCRIPDVLRVFDITDEPAL